MIARIVYLHALTPLHTGTGQTVAVIDLPVAREKATHWPVIPGSSIKGVLRAHFDPRSDVAEGDWRRQAFGDQERAGGFLIGDQRILCLPVRSYYGVFAYVTCPLALRRLSTDMKAFGLNSFPVPGELSISDDELLVPDQPVSVLQGQGAEANKAFLEDLDLTIKASEPVRKIAAYLSKILFDEATHFTSRFAVISDAVFSFLCETGTEVVARIALNDRGTTTGDGGNLWYEEAVPAEAIFAGPLLVDTRLQAANAEYLAHVNSLRETVVQIGGKASVGRGLCRVRIGGGG